MDMRLKNIRLLLTTLFLSLFSINLFAQPLTDYLAVKEPLYEWKLIDKEATPDGTAYFIHFASQTWLSGKEVDRTLWRHWMVIYVPNRLREKTALLYISGGDNKDEYKTLYQEKWFEFAKQSGAVVAELFNIPNQPLIFKNDPAHQERTEDEILSFGWAQFYKTNNPEWLPHLPMVKSTVKAMDVIESFCADKTKRRCPVTQFILSGKSKRGWTTWLTATQDKRVVGIAPMVFDVLNFGAHLQHQLVSFGDFSPALRPYQDQGILQTRDSVEFNNTLKIIDPFSYLDKLTLPKMIINATGDRFFPPDSSQFYWPALKGTKHLRYIPNTDHALDESAYMSILSFFQSVTHHRPLPELTWQKEADCIKWKTNTAPLKTTLWKAENNKRDFRIQSSATWKNFPLEVTTKEQDGLFSYAYCLNDGKKTTLYEANMIELQFENKEDLQHPIILTTEVYVTSPKTPLNSN